MDRRLINILKVARTFLVGTIITLAIAAMFPFKGDEGSSAALLTLCSVAIFSLGLVSRLKLDFPSTATLMSLVLGAAAAWFWLVSEHPIDVSRAETLRGLLYALGFSAVFGLVAAGVNIATLRKKDDQGTDGDSA